MTPEQLFHQLLNLGRQWRGTRCEYAPKADTVGSAPDGVVRLWIEETPELWLYESTLATAPVRCDYRQSGDASHFARPPSSALTASGALPFLVPSPVGRPP